MSYDIERKASLCKKHNEMIRKYMEKAVMNKNKDDKGLELRKIIRSSEDCKECNWFIFFG